MYKTMGGVCAFFDLLPRLPFCFHNFILPMFFITEMTQFGNLNPFLQEGYATNIMTNPNRRILRSCLNEEKENIKQPYQGYGSKH